METKLLFIIGYLLGLTGLVLALLSIKTKHFKKADKLQRWSIFFVAASTVLTGLGFLLSYI